MLFIALLSIIYAFEPVQMHTSYQYGYVVKFFSAYEKVILPDKPLIDVDIWISLRHIGEEHGEYAKPYPMAYIGRNFIPEYDWDYSLNLTSLQGSLAIDRIPKCEFLIIRIDGGLNNEFFLSNNYDGPEWEYSITISYRYCESGYFIAYKSPYCNIPLISNNENVENQFASIISIPEYTQKLIIKGSNLTASPYNFNFTESSLTEITVNWPASGKWFIYGIHSFGYSTEKCTSGAYGNECNGIVVANLGRLNENRIYEIRKFKDMKQIFYILNVLEEDVNFMFEVKMKTEEVGYAVGFTNPYDTYKLPFLRAGTNFLVLNTSSYYFTITKKIDSSLCNGHPYALYNNLAFICKCTQHYTGRHCEDKSMPDYFYYIHVSTLFFSNLAMTPAVISGLLYGLYGEVIIFASNMIASGIYHLCDYNFECFNMDYRFLHTLDFILSYLSVLITFVYLIRIKNKELKLGVFSLLFVLIMVIGTGKGFNSIVTEILVFAN